MLAFLLNNSHFNTFTWRPSASPISSSHGGPVQSPSPVHMEAQCRAHLQFTWRPSASPISSSHGVQCRAHLQFTWRSSAGPISSSHRGPVQGPPPQSGTRHATQLGCCQPGLHHQGTRLKDKVSTLVICIQAGHQYMQNQCKQQGCHPAVLQTLS